jgi:hypothetical protein
MSHPLGTMVDMREVAGGTERLERLRQGLAEREWSGEAPGAAEVALAAWELDGVAERLAGLDPAVLTDPELVEVTSRLEVAQRRLDAARMRLHAALDARGATIDECGHTTKQWLGAEHSMSGSEAGRRVRVANKVCRHLPLVAEALAAGAVTFEHARVLADLLTPRVHDIVVELQAELLALAEGARFEQWVRDVRDLINLADPDGGHDPSPERNKVSLGDGLDGEVFANVTLVGDAAAVVRHALNAKADELFHRAKKDCEVTGGELAMPSRGQLLAQALVELCRAGHKGTGPATDSTVVIDASDPTTGRTREGVRLADGTTRLLCCDSVFHALVRDRTGRAVHLASPSRFATPEQRRAAMVRDGGCVFPDCDAPPGWVDLHHVIHWQQGGPTELANLASLCRHHHGVTHRKGWTMVATADEWFTWTTPGGRILHSQRHGRPRAPARTGP